MIPASGTLVIGYGNTLRGDDGAGFYVAEQLGAGAIACQQLTPELAERIAQAERVVFVDAHAGVPVGRIAIEPLRPRESAALHRFDPENLLAWSQQLYGRAPEAILIGIGGESFELGQSLSTAARRAMREAVRTIRRVTTADAGLMIYSRGGSSLADLPPCTGAGSPRGSEVVAEPRA